MFSTKRYSEVQRGAGGHWNRPTRGRGRGRGRGGQGGYFVREKFDFDYDLYDGKSDVFLIRYDFFSPRPYFAILTHNHQDWTKFDAKDPDFIGEMVDVAFSFVGEEFSSPVLMVSRGTQISRFSTSFIAHIATEKEEYLAHYRSHKDDIPGWPEKMRPNRQWVASQDPFEYEANVRGYPYTSKKPEEIAEIKLLIEVVGTGDDHDHEERVASLCQPGEGWELVFHPSEPRIGFKRTGETSRSNWKDEVKELLGVMESFVKKNSLGCKIHISLTKQPIGGFEEEGDRQVAQAEEEEDKTSDGKVEEKERKEEGDEEEEDKQAEKEDAEAIHAFLYLAGQDFYKVCPPPQRQQWFEQFQLRMISTPCSY